MFELNNKNNIIMVIVVIIGLAYVCKCFKKLNNENNENFEEQQQKVVVKYFYMPWCGYCKKLSPIWDKLENKYENNPNIQLKKINCEKEPQEARQNNIEGFPTIISFSSGKKVTYEGDRTMNDLTDFIEKQ
jgi:protein disulfide-isomerase-like protein